jgi:hypothetical protein
MITDEQKKWSAIMAEVLMLIEKNVDKLNMQGQPGKAILVAIHGKTVLDLILNQECFDEEKVIQ